MSWRSAWRRAPARTPSPVLPAVRRPEVRPLPAPQYSVEAGQQRAQRLEVRAAERLREFLFDLGHGRAHHPCGGVAALGEADTLGATVVTVLDTLEVAERLQLPEEVVQRLLRHAQLSCDLDRAEAIGAGIAQDDEMGGNHVGEPLVVQRLEHAGADHVDRHAQERAEQWRAKGRAGHYS